LKRRTRADPGLPPPAIKEVDADFGYTDPTAIPNAGPLSSHQIQNHDFPAQQRAERLCRRLRSEATQIENRCGGRGSSVLDIRNVILRLAV
jgi:hypothetical protein